MYYKQFFDQLVDLLYPRICFHCNRPIESKAILVCKDCSEHFVFSEKIFSSRNQFCIAQFDSFGAVKTVQRKLERADHIFLAKHLALFYFVAWEKQEWHMPSIVCFFNELPFYKRDCAKKIIVNSLSKFLKIPLLACRINSEKCKLEGEVVLFIELVMNVEKWEEVVDFYLKRGAKRVYGLSLTAN